MSPSVQTKFFCMLSRLDGSWSCAVCGRISVFRAYSARSPVSGRPCIFRVSCFVCHMSFSIGSAHVPAFSIAFRLLRLSLSNGALNGDTPSIGRFRQRFLPPAKERWGKSAQSQEGTWKKPQRQEGRKARARAPEPLCSGNAMERSREGGCVFSPVSGDSTFPNGPVTMVLVKESSAENCLPQPIKSYAPSLLPYLGGVKDNSTKRERERERETARKLVPRYGVTSYHSSDRPDAQTMNRGEGGGASNSEMNFNRLAGQTPGANLC